MSGLRHIHLRAARDRLIDLLGIGQTAPLPDVDVQEFVIVRYNERARIRIDPAEADVRYLPYHDRSPAYEKGGYPGALGKGEGAEVLTPPITEDTTFRILARKTFETSANKGPPASEDTKGTKRRETYLDQLAQVRVGVNRALAARIVSAPLLDENWTGDDAARIIDYAGRVTVEVDDPQEGVVYELVRQLGPSEWEVLSKKTGPCKKGEPVTLDTIAMSEDADIRVQATKDFDLAEGHEPAVKRLDAIMPLKVRANPAVAVTVGASIVNSGEGTFVTVGDTQTSVRYQLHHRSLTWSDFPYGDHPEPTVSIPIPEEPDVTVRRPPRTANGTGALPKDLESIDQDKSGTGGDITFDLDVPDDIVLVVTAVKDHPGKDHPRSRSVVQLEQAAVVLTRPDPDQELSLTIDVREGYFAGEMLVEGGQPGVLYYFSRTPGGEPLSLHPAYFHRPDAGLGKLRIGADFVVSRDPEPGEDTLSPLAPKLQLADTTDLVGKTLHVRAVKAWTRVATNLKRPVCPEEKVEPTP